MANMNSFIRKAMPEEHSILTEIAIESKAYWGYSERFINDCVQELTVSQDDLLNPLYTYWLVLLDEQIAGYASLHPTLDDTVELDALFIKPEFMGKGAGRMLFEHFLPLLQVSAYRRLTIVSDPNATKFYKKMGAHFVGQRASGSIADRFLPVYEILLN